MSEEINKENEVIEETKEENKEENKEEEEIKDDEKGEDKEEEDKGKEGEEKDDEEFDDSKIDVDSEVRGGKKEVKKEKENDDEEEDDVDDEDEKRINKIVDKRVGSKLQELENKQEVDSFLLAKPEYTKYKGAILKYVSHPAYSKVPIYNIAAIVAAKDMKKLGAKEEREAQKTVDKTKSPGTTARKTDGGKIDWATATPAEVAAQRQKILHPEN